MKRSRSFVAGLLISLAGSGCKDEVVQPLPPPDQDLYVFANGCFSVAASASSEGSPRWLAPTQTRLEYAATATEPTNGSRFFMKASDLGTYLLYDEERHYLVAEEGRLLRQRKLQSDILLLDDSYVSGAEWELVALEEESRFQLRSRRSGEYLTASGGLGAEEDAAVVTFHPQTECAEHPELTLDAAGEVARTTFDDGAVFGIVDAHSHMFTNFGFGGGGIFHGAPFHRLGVEHALSDCTQFHGIEGRKDLLGFAFDKGTEGNLNIDVLLPSLLLGTLSEFSHNTEGYPKFTDWPNAPFSSTHQTQYYRWLERAYRGGLRLVVQHATTNSAMCELISGQDIQAVRYSCNDMVTVDRSIEEAYNLERYIDAQSGGEGRGWFRLVKTPAEARAVISEGKLAVILGIEVSNLFDCFLVQPEGMPTCDEAFLLEQLNRYHELGIRAVFPTHKYDNAFSAGDGHRTISEIGNFANSGHWSSFTLDCPEGVASAFDKGDVTFGGLNQPREEFFGPPPNDMSGFAEAPVNTLIPFLEQLQAPALVGEYCQSHGLTPLGETLINELMKRGMIVEIDHLPQWSYQRAFDLLEANGYPAAATHGTEYSGKIYENGGISKMNFSRCPDPERPGSMIDSLRDRTARMAAAGGYPAPGFGFDLNGFAGAADPRFGDKSPCTTPQKDPVTYPFTSFGGDVTFTEPRIGERQLDFNTEGLVHVGLLPELIEDARRTGASDEDLEPLFRSAEGYLRMWERAEARSLTMND